MRIAARRCVHTIGGNPYAHTAVQHAGINTATITIHHHNMQYRYCSKSRLT